MKLFSENIEHFAGEKVKVYISHKIYGEQELNVRKFQPICNENKIGFIVGKQEIFLEPDEINTIEMVGRNMIKISSLLREIKIKKI